MGRTDAQPAVVILGSLRIFELFLDVLDGDQSFQVELFVDHRQLFDAVPLQQALGLFERCADRDGDQILLGHHRADGLFEVFLEAQVTVRQDAHQPRAARYGQARDAVLVHQFERVPPRNALAR